MLFAALPILRRCAWAEVRAGFQKHIYGYWDGLLLAVVPGGVVKVVLSGVERLS